MCRLILLCFVLSGAVATMNRFDWNFLTDGEELYLDRISYFNPKRSGQFRHDKPDINNPAILQSAHPNMGCQVRFR